MSHPTEVGPAAPATREPQRAAWEPQRATWEPQPPRALYLHVPFCLSVCPYCDFVVYAGREAHGPQSRLETLVEALIVEIELRAEHAGRAFGKLPPLASVYLGGGTPSLLSAEQVARLFEAVDATFGIAAAAELTLETNPGPADRGDLRGFRSAGINRLSIGAQSMNADELRALGRRHSSADVRATIRLARSAGFDSISLDLLYDVPGQTPATWRRTLHSVLSLEPDHISAYALALDDPDAEGWAGPLGDHLPVRRGARRWRDRARAAQDADGAAECYELADQLLEGAGMRWYELSNWARPGKESRHNLAYWSGDAYEAAGPGAHAFDGALTRRWNTARLDAYLHALLPTDGGAVTLPDAGTDHLDRQTATAERAILALRTRAGLPQRSARLASVHPAIAWGRSVGLLEDADAGTLRLSLRGRLLASEVFWRLLPDGANRAA